MTTINDNVLIDFLKVYNPKLYDAYIRYKMDKIENIYKVGGIFYTILPGYGRPGRRVIITDIKEFNTNGIIKKDYHIIEVDKNNNPTNNDLGAIYSTFEERIQEDDERIQNVVINTKNRIIEYSNGSEFMQVYLNLMPEHEMKTLDNKFGEYIRYY